MMTGIFDAVFDSRGIMKVKYKRFSIAVKGVNT